MENKVENKEEEKPLIKVEANDIFKNNGEEGKPLWTVIHSKVYDITEFNHPGGKDVFIVGDEDDMDKGDEFDSIHGPAAKKQAKLYFYNGSSSYKSRFSLSIFKDLSL